MMQITNNRYRGGISGREFRGPAPGSVAIVSVPFINQVSNSHSISMGT